MSGAPLFKRWVGPDKVEVRAVKGDVPEAARAYPVESAYPLFVAGVHRGFLVYQAPGYRNRHSHRGWAVRSLRPYDPENPERGFSMVETTHSTAPGIGEALLSKVPSLVARGRMPTAEEANAAAAEEAARRKDQRRERAAQDAEAAARRVEDRARAEERTAEMVAGLESLRGRGDLSNLERVALIEAMNRLGIRP
jgi:hypothetical protein